VEGDPGHQGYHGLKGQIYDDFIRLGALTEEKMSKIHIPEETGNYYILSTSVIATDKGNYDFLTGKDKPSNLYINHSRVDPKSKTIQLNKGANLVLAVYDKACETYLAFRKSGIPKPGKQPISMCWYKDYGLLPFDCSPSNKARSGLFAFDSAPGLTSFTFEAYGKVMVWIDGLDVKPIPGSKQTDGLTSYKVELSQIKTNKAQVVLKIEYQPGYKEGAALPQFIRQNCGKGSIVAGDWSKIQGLKAYSGGVWYRKKIIIEASDVKNRLELDLGEVISTAEVLVNGKSAGIKLTPPWKFDISGLTTAGENRIEILVYNTLANHYTTIPTRYPGSLVSGLLGPVILNIFNR